MPPLRVTLYVIGLSAQELCAESSAAKSNVGNEEDFILCGKKPKNKTKIVMHYEAHAYQFCWIHAFYRLDTIG